MLDASPLVLEVPLEIPGVAPDDGFAGVLLLSLDATADGVASVLAALLLNGFQFHGQYALLVQLSPLLEEAQPVRPIDATNNAAKRNRLTLTRARLKLMTTHILVFVKSLTARAGAASKPSCCK
jgi:hypothetical protein